MLRNSYNKVLPCLLPLCWSCSQDQARCIHEESSSLTLLLCELAAVWLQAGVPVPVWLRQHAAGLQPTLHASCTLTKLHWSQRHPFPGSAQPCKCKQNSQ